ncbi:MAG TPA: hypothetical protein PKD70_15615 [Saprospiraceae bacterium]|nr:hypothetical protein [Saprospiraceae bacterium]HMP15306.1 hypothetical protein [Saprospiraceae bacterium]
MTTQNILRRLLLASASYTLPQESVRGQLTMPSLVPDYPIV